MPQLSTFINDHSSEILDAWQTFAKDLPAATGMDVAALRDHALGMLQAIATDLGRPQTEQQRNQKARGLLDAARDSMSSEASKHGRGRAQRGFSVESTVAEFRALRASVIALWVEQQQTAGPDELEEMRRFNEAIDQAIAESLAQYTQEVEGARDRFLAVLGHDLRTPLAAILTSSRFLLEEAPPSDTRRNLIEGMERSGRRMAQLVDNLLDAVLSRFGDTIPLRRGTTDLGVLVREVGDEVGASSPSARISVETSGNLEGEWDRTRLEQALTNLLSNAVQHGSPGKTIRVTASGDADQSVTIAITNEGRAIPKEDLNGLFGPMKAAATDRASRRHLGLGLYIVDRIVDAHGGSVDVRSSEERGTTFLITMPRHEALRTATH